MWPRKIAIDGYLEYWNGDPEKINVKWVGQWGVGWGWPQRKKNWTDKAHERDAWKKFEETYLQQWKTSVPEEWMKLLEKGLKYCPDSYNHWYLEILASSTKSILDVSRKPSSDKYLITRNFIVNNIQRYNDFEKRIIRKIENKIQSNNLIMSKADKADDLALLTNIDYGNKMTNELKRYKYNDSDSTDFLQRCLRIWIY